MPAQGPGRSPCEVEAPADPEGRRRISGPPASIEGTERAALQVAAGDKLATITLTGWADGATCHVQGMALVH